LEIAVDIIEEDVPTSIVVRGVRAWNSSRISLENIVQVVRLGIVVVEMKYVACYLHQNMHHDVLF